MSEILMGPDEQKARDWFAKAARVARNYSTCQRKKFGTIIVSEAGKFIGSGHNSPPGESEDLRRCDQDKNEISLKVIDRTCCMHSERRAMHYALQYHPEEIKGSTIYHIELDRSRGDKMRESNSIYCGSCSKDAVDLGVKEWIVRRKEGIKAYSAIEYEAECRGFRSSVRSFD